jgi:hypothetical protein
MKCLRAGAVKRLYCTLQYVRTHVQYSAYVEFGFVVVEAEKRRLGTSVPGLEVRDWSSVGHG